MQVWWVLGMGVVLVCGKEMNELDLCKNTCVAVPEDLWPRCCETHNTCCVKFAESCMVRNTISLIITVTIYHCLAGEMTVVAMTVKVFQCMGQSMVGGINVLVLTMWVC